MISLKKGLCWSLLLTTIIAAMVTWHGIRLNEKDEQIRAMLGIELSLVRANRAMMERLRVLTFKVEELERRVQRLDMTASWYGPGFHGRTAANGSVYDQEGMTVAHKWLPFGTVMVIEYRGRRTTAVVTDRGPYIDGRDLDLSLGVADALRFTDKGVDEVTVYLVEV